MGEQTQPRHSDLLELPDGQLLYWEESGAAEGVPALYLHGGPGGTLGNGGYRERFDLSRTRLIGFEQRGCGRSIPHASAPEVSLEHNTTEQLIRDIEMLREHRGVEAWILNGVSWGSTLALAYAQAHPDRVLGIVLVAVTTTSTDEVDWITEGVGAIFPEAWERLAAHAENAGIGYRRGQGRVVDAYAQLMNSPDSAIRDAASQEWALWEDTHISIGAGGFHRASRWKNEQFRHAFVRLTTHYWANSGFSEPPLLQRMSAVASIPGILIHGRRDISGPVLTAWRLHRAWPGSTLIIDEGDGHGGASMVGRWSAANAELITRCTDPG